MEAAMEAIQSGNEKKPATKTGLNLLFKETHLDHFLRQDMENSIHHTSKVLAATAGKHQLFETDYRKF